MSTKGKGNSRNQKSTKRDKTKAQKPPLRVTHIQNEGNQNIGSGTQYNGPATVYESKNITRSLNREFVTRSCSNLTFRKI